jgi:hypothetical protein
MKWGQNNHSAGLFKKILLHTWQYYLFLLNYFTSTVTKELLLRIEIIKITHTQVILIHKHAMKWGQNNHSAGLFKKYILLHTWQYYLFLLNYFTSTVTKELLLRIEIVKITHTQVILIHKHAMKWGQNNHLAGLFKNNYYCICDNTIYFFLTISLRLSQKKIIFLNFET